MKKREKYNYKNPAFESLRQPMRGVMRAYGEAERYFAVYKETSWEQWGMKSLTDYIHALEHIQPEAVDEFKEILAEVGLPVEYPGIDEVITAFENLDELFESCVEIIDTTDDALRSFCTAIDTEHPELGALARGVETLLTKNSAERTFLLEAWSMWDNSDSVTSFDNWVEHHAPHFQRG